jgi:hypothetical protein
MLNPGPLIGCQAPAGLSERHENQSALSHEGMLREAVWVAVASETREARPMV